MYATFEAPYQRRLLVQGFGEGPRVDAADGSTVTSDATVTGSQAINAVKIDVPKSAGGDVREREFVPLSLGRDGNNPESVRPVAAEPGPYVFGGGRDDTMDPDVTDPRTPDGVTQGEALDRSATERATIRTARCR